LHTKPLRFIDLPREVTPVDDAIAVSGAARMATERTTKPGFDG
jgi:hypothetical protein